MSSSLTHKPAWQALMQHAAELRSSHLAELFAADAGRFDSLHRAFGPLLFDFSKQRLDARTLPLLFDLAAEQGLAELAALNGIGQTEIQRVPGHADG